MHVWHGLSKNISLNHLGSDFRFEVGEGVDCNVVEINAEVKMGAGAGSGATDIADEFTFGDGLSFGEGEGPAEHVAVEAADVLTVDEVVDDCVNAEGSGWVADLLDRAVGDGVDGSTFARVQVQSFMEGGAS